MSRIRYTNPDNGWTVALLEVAGQPGLVTAVGALAGAEPGVGLRLTGRWEVDPRWGRQFRAGSFTPLEPATVLGLQRYLGSGLVEGVGPAVATRLVQRFGLETLDIIEHTPERLLEVAGIGRVRAERIRAAWNAQRATRDIMVFLEGHGISPALARRIHRHYGDLAMAVVREDPYRLADEVPGIGFRRADRIARDVGIPSDSPARLRAGLVFTLSQLAAEGHTAVPRATLLTVAAETLGEGPEGPRPSDALSLALDGLVGDGRMVEEGGEAAATVLLPLLAAAEKTITAAVLRLCRGPLEPLAIPMDAAIAVYEERRRITLAPLQRQAVEAALREKLVIVTGGPGTGKTTLIQGMVDILAAARRSVSLCAPTGRAAQRLGEATGQEARTIHRLLEFDHRGGVFRRNAANPLDADHVIADEASMIDTPLMADLVSALAPGARLVLVGDVDQLPSVGPGNVLGDLIASGLPPVIRLSEVFRQAQESRIVLNAHRIHQGQALVREEGRDDFFWIARHDPEDILKLVVQIVSQDIPRRFGLSPTEDVQVLAPMRRGPLGTGNLNLALQAVLNPEGEPVQSAGGNLRVGDRVMQLENDYPRDVFNGDTGRIAGLDAEGGQVLVRFGGRTVAYDARDLDALGLAYATSVHKAQGSEYPAVVIPLHTQHYVLLQRRLLYTAVTRGRRLVVLVGSPRALQIAIGNRHVPPRHTLLAARLKAALDTGG